jgi:hypothetical protein
MKFKETKREGKHQRGSSPGENKGVSHGGLAIDIKRV